MSSTTSAVRRQSQIDPSARARLNAACAFMNAEVSKANRRLHKAGVVFVLLGALLFVLLWQNGVEHPWRAFFVAVLGYALWTPVEYAGLSKTYKQVVIGRVIAALGEGLTYSAESRFKKQDFIDLDLFSRRLQQWSSEDEISGRKGAVVYSMFEAKATGLKVSREGAETETFFHGLIVRLDFNKHFRGHTIVVPNSESQVFDGMVEGLGEYETRKAKQLCHMDNVTFEKWFSVYSTDQQEARYVLTPKSMELILATYVRFNGARCCFKDSSVFLAIPSNADRFEVSFTATMTPENAIGELAECVALAENLIDALDLETRIWTKV